MIYTHLVKFRGPRHELLAERPMEAATIEALLDGFDLLWGDAPEAQYAEVLSWETSGLVAAIIAPSSRNPGEYYCQLWDRHGDVSYYTPNEGVTEHVEEVPA